MNNFLKIIIFLTVILAFFSCSDEFINEKLDISGVAESAIIISPEWDPDDYQFKCEGVENADFSINSKPDWLIVDSNSGKFADSLPQFMVQQIRNRVFQKQAFMSIRC